MKTFVQPVSVEELRALLSYDQETGELRWNPGTCRAGKTAGRFSQEGYREVKVLGHSLLAHRVIWAMHYGAWPTQQIDHINRNKADNRISNLRLATASQNSANRGALRTNRHGGKGVTPTRFGDWQAQIQIDGKNRYLGTFKKKSEALAAYAAAALDHFGSFAHVEVSHG